MILVDTSVWIEHLRGTLPELSQCLEQGTIAHLISSALLSQATLWTRDRRLAAVADELRLAY